MSSVMKLPGTSLRLVEVKTYKMGWSDDTKLKLFGISPWNLNWSWSDGAPQSTKMSWSKEPSLNTLLDELDSWNSIKYV